MNINLINNSSQIVILNINSGDPVFVQPFKIASITLKDSADIKFLVKCNYTSFVYKSIFQSKKYYLVIESEIYFSGVSDGEIFHINSEKIQISYDVFYERFFILASKALPISETHKIDGENKIKSLFNKSRLFDVLLFQPLLDTTDLFLILLVIGIVITIFLGWKFTVVYVPISYLILIITNRFLDKFLGKIGKKAFKIQDTEEQFYNYFDDEFIKKYYSNTERISFM